MPALGYLEEFDRLVEKSKPENGGLSPAELAYLLNNFNPAELYQYGQARDLSIALLEEWLVQYKFKKWKVTEGSHTRVTPAMRRNRAAEIGRQLSDTKLWHSHGRGISMEVARRQLKLQINDLEDQRELRTNLAAYHALLLDYRIKRGYGNLVIDWKGGCFGY